MIEKAYLVWQPLCGHVFGAYWATTPERALADATAEFDIEVEPPERLEALDIEDMLAQAIRGLETADWTAGVSGYRHCVYLDPAGCDVYQWSHVGAGCPQPVWDGRHLEIFETSGHADLIPASVVEVLLSRIDLLVRVCVERANGTDPDDSGTAHCELERWHPELQHYWDPGDWYADCADEIERLVAQGHSPDEIVDQLDTGDHLNGCVRVEAAREWMAEHVESVLAAADVCEPCASEGESNRAAWAAQWVGDDGRRGPTERICEGCAASDGWEGGDYELLHRLGAAQTTPGRVCYGCGRELDPHAGLSTTYCGRCGDAR